MTYESMKSKNYPLTKHIGVAHLTDVHPADDVRIYHKECRSLAEAGYSVVLVAPESDWSLPEVAFLPIGKPKGRFPRLILGPLRVFRQAIKSDANIYHLHDPELIPAGLVLKLLRKKVIYDAHEDLAAQVAHKAYMGSATKWIARAASKILCDIVSIAFDGVIAATPGIGATFPPRKTWVVRNFPRLEELSPGLDAVPVQDRPFHAIYVGGISESRGIMDMLDAAALLGPRLGFRLLLAGKFENEELEGQARVHPGWAFTEFLGWLDRPGIASALGRARCGLVLLHPTPAYVESLPVKLFEYMASGLPVIASRFDLWVGLLDGKVLFSEPRNGEALAKAIEGLLLADDAMAAMAIQARDAVQSNFHWGIEEEALLACYETVSLA